MSRSIFEGGRRDRPGPRRRACRALLLAFALVMPFSTFTHPALKASASGPLSMTAETTNDAARLLDSPPVTTAVANTLLVAFAVGTGGGNTVSGGGLAWTDAVTGGNGTTGQVDIWWAVAAGTITNQVIHDQRSTSSDAGMITVAAFTGADLLDPIHSIAVPPLATNAAAAVNGAPTVNVTTTRNNGWVWAAGIDWDVVSARTAGTAQTIVDQYPDFNARTTYWVQKQNAATAISGTSVTSNDTAPLGGHWNLAAAEIRSPNPGTTPVTFAFSVNASSLDGAGTSIHSRPISTTLPNQVLIAFDSFQCSNTLGAVNNANGGGLGWTRASYQNTQNAFVEVWYAVAYSPVTNLTLTMTNLNACDSGTLVLTAWSGIDPEAPLGAINAATATTGAPSVSVTTTRADSWVWGVGVDETLNTARTVVAGQTMEHEVTDAGCVCDLWVQHQTTTTPSLGSVPISDTLPSNHHWELIAVEIMPVGATPVLALTAESFPGPASLTTAPFSTAAVNTLLVAFVSAPSEKLSYDTNSTVSGGGLTWIQGPWHDFTTGEVSIWWTLAASIQTNITVTVTRQSITSYGGAVTVQGFTGVDTQNPIGAIASADGNACGLCAAETVGLTTLRNNSLVWGVGVDDSSTTARTIGGGQTMVDENPDSAGQFSDDYWVQKRTLAVTPIGATTISDTGPNGSRWGLAAVEIMPPLASGAPALGVHVRAVSSFTSTTLKSTPITTTLSNQVLVAFIATLAQTAVANPITPAVGGVTGGGLTWTRAVTTSTQYNSAEVWWALAAAPVTNLQISATQTSASVPGFAIVTAWSGADTTTPIGATASGNAATGVPTKNLTTTRANSSVWGVGTDWTDALSRVSPANQGLNWEMKANSGDTHWLQRPKVRSASGTVVTINDTAPGGDRWDLSLVEIMPQVCASGSLTATPPVSVGFPGATLSPTSQTVTTTFDNVESDLTNTGAGWHYTGTSTAFASGAHTLPTTATTITAASAVAGAPSCVVPTNTVGYPLTLPAAVGSAPTAVSLYNATAGTGLGVSTVTISVSLVVPPYAYTGAYTSTWTLSITSGP